MPYHKPPTAPSLRIEPVACLIHVNASGLVDPDGSLQSIVRNIRENAQKFGLMLAAAMRQNGFFFVIK
jgi:hypothetical protein